MSLVEGEEFEAKTGHTLERAAFVLGHLDHPGAIKVAVVGRAAKPKPTQGLAVYAASHDDVGQGDALADMRAAGTGPVRMMGRSHFGHKPPVFIGPSGGGPGSAVERGSNAHPRHTSHTMTVGVEGGRTHFGRTGDEGRAAAVSRAVVQGCGFRRRFEELKSWHGPKRWRRRAFRAGQAGTFTRRSVPLR